MWHRILILALFIGLLVSCKEIPGVVSHNIDLGGKGHGSKLYTGAKNCAACHGASLNGNGYIPGCYSCHGEMWGLGEHLQNRGGRSHMYGVIQAKTKCSQCHGSDLKGNGGGPNDKFQRPSCYKCHGDNWTGLSNHKIDKGGFLHGTGLWKPTTNCADCHGSDLKGNKSPNSGAVSCYSCHGAKWLIADHTLNKGSYLHKTTLYEPEDNCVECHGSDLKGDDGPSCYDCHSAYWNNIPHNDSEEGAKHASGKGSPASNCAGCHGSDLKGDDRANPDSSIPSCYKCHGAKWSGGGDKVAPKAIKKSATAVGYLHSTN
jgi:hypothetical protein